DDFALGGEQRVPRHRLLRDLDDPLEHRAERGVAVAGQRLEGSDRSSAEGTEPWSATDRALPEQDLAVGQGVIEARPQHPRRVAERALARPEPDARRFGLRGIHLLLVPLLPAPRE